MAAEMGAKGLANVLMVREPGSMMPVEGSYYHWVKRAFGPLGGFMAGWNHWGGSWLDVAISPVFAASYLSYFLPALDSGTSLCDGRRLPAVAGNPGGIRGVVEAALQRPRAPRQAVHDVEPYRIAEDAEAK